MAYFIKTKKRELVPEGSHIARCYAFIELGTIIEKFGTHLKLRFEFEIPGEMRVFDEAKGEQPMVIGIEYNAVMNKKSSLYGMIAGWLGKIFTDKEPGEFDTTELVGLSCLLNVKHRISEAGNDYAVIDSISPVPKEMKKQLKPQILKSQVLTYVKWNQEIFDSLPDFIQKKMKDSKEYIALKDPNHKPEEPEDLNGPGNDLPWK
jgi:hypothetical protein